MEVWPGGRYNHYIFDLNRDWAWQTQLESQQRLALYNEWLPQMHVDVHEMGYNSPYFFPPSAEPWHEYIEKYQKDFHNTLGAKLLASLMLKIGCTTPENDLICFILVMGIPTQPITEQLE
jgi:N-formylglutamate amidohydrolase